MTVTFLFHEKAIWTKFPESRLRNIFQQTVRFLLFCSSLVIAYHEFTILEDVLKARLKTMGVVEHTFSISSGSNRGVDWKIYDESKIIDTEVLEGWDVGS